MIHSALDYIDSVRGVLSSSAIAGVLPPMSLPSTAATPANKTLHQDFADIFSLPAVRKAEAGLDLPLLPGKLQQPHEMAFLMERNAVIAWQQCDIKSARGEGAAMTGTSHSWVPSLW